MFFIDCFLLLIITVFIIVRSQWVIVKEHHLACQMFHQSRSLITISIIEPRIKILQNVPKKIKEIVCKKNASIVE